MTKITEDHIENLAIELLQNLGYQYQHGSILAPNGDQSERENYHQVVLKSRLLYALNNINYHLPESAKEQALRALFDINSSDLINNNEIFHKYLTEGIEVEYQKDGITRGDKVWLIDFAHPENNDYLVVNQFTIVENNHERRPDLILFINGLPLVVIELKNPQNTQADLLSAYKQLQTYKAEIPSLFIYNSVLIISDGLEAKTGSLSADFSRFLTWKEPETANLKINELEIVINGMLNHSTLLDIIRHFIVFEKSKSSHKKNKITTVETIKKITAYHQYYAVNKALEKIKIASSEIGDRKGGVIWHTQGSGKSLSMVFLTGKLVLNLNNPTIVILTDRNDLDCQLFNTFAGCRQIIRQNPVQADNREQLKELLNVASGGVVFTTIQKFYTEEEKGIYPVLSSRFNIVVIADEAHRTQYGFKAKQIDIKNEQGEVIGKNTAYGFAKYIRDALPNATFVGFTGTPVEQKDKNTPAIFGDYIDIYDISQSINDRATVPIYYESRLINIHLDEKGKKLLAELDEDLEFEDLNITQKNKAKGTRIEAIVGATKRLQKLAKDIITHFENRQKVFLGKGMIVTMSRKIAVNLYEQIIKICPEWHDQDLTKGQIKVVMTANASDGPKMAKHHTNKSERELLADRLKKPEDNLNLVIVCDMWLTGFDAPCLHTLYIDKPMKGHNLMQAIARINRVYSDKPGGLVVDYLGIGNELKEAMAFYAESGGKGKAIFDQKQAINLMLEKLKVVEELLLGCDYEDYFTTDTRSKLNIILQTTEHILKIENGKERFNQGVTALSQAFVLSIPSPEAMKINEKISFFQAVQTRLKKFDLTDSELTNYEIETTIIQVVDQAIISDEIIDIFAAAGIKKSNVSILSDEFLLEVKSMKHQNLAIELLKKLLNDQIKTINKTNIALSKNLLEMLENTLVKYQKKLLTGLEIIEELINIAKEIKAADQRGEELELTDYELAFYDALASNNNAREIMGIEKLRELTIVLVERVREKASIDWNIREDMRSQMKVIVKRLLKQYGYPPDMEKLAAELVLEQASYLW